MLLPLRSRRGLGLAVAAVTAAAVGPLALLSPQLATAATPPQTDRTSALEARRVDRVKVGKINWGSCGGSVGECAEIRLPLDYDEPNGPTTLIALARIKAAKPEQRIGTLFVNPGGPGASAVDTVLAADQFIGQQVRDRFDIVGVDPRGIGYGDRLQCFKTAAEQQAVFAGFGSGVPVTPAEFRRRIRSNRAFAKACATNGGALAASMSTAQVARDMDVVRRALGDEKLTFLGGSYGSVLGQMYANMFPDRVRAIVLDGVMNAVELTTGRNGTGRTVPTDVRQGTADGSYRALREFLRRCDKAGAPTCAFAGSGNSLKKFDVLAQRLKKKPLTLPEVGTLDYGAMVFTVLTQLYKVDVGPELAAFMQDAYTATDQTVPAARQVAAGRRALARTAQLQAELQTVASQARIAPRAVDSVKYDFKEDAFFTVSCLDSVNPKDPKTWIATGQAADRRAPYFGAKWNWQSSVCAESIWTARDEDRYLGPFNRRTAKPVLVVGSYYDPSTPYTHGAVEVAKLLPNSRLLSSSGWGHAGYGDTPCVTSAVDEYFLNGTLPAKGTVCTGPQPFEKSATSTVTRRNGSSGRTAAIR